jgi:cytochrome c
MSGLEGNKIAAAVLVAGIVALSASIVADMVVAPEELKQNAYQIEVTDGGPVADASSTADADKVEPIEPYLAKASIEHGEQLAKVCSSCHSFEKGGAAKVGPNLWGIIGAKHAHMDGFSYSDAIKKFPGNWDYDQLNQFLRKPSQYLPGTKMGFAGYKKEQDRADVIDWLRTQSDNPPPLP